MKTKSPAISNPFTVSVDTFRRELPKITKYFEVHIYGFPKRRMTDKELGEERERIADRIRELRKREPCEDAVPSFEDLKRSLPPVIQGEHRMRLEEPKKIANVRPLLEEIYEKSCIVVGKSKMIRELHLDVNDSEIRISGKTADPDDINLQNSEVLKSVPGFTYFLEMNITPDGLGFSEKHRFGIWNLEFVVMGTCKSKSASEEDNSHTHPFCVNVDCFTDPISATLMPTHFPTNTDVFNALDLHEKRFSILWVPFEISITREIFSARRKEAIKDAASYALQSQVLGVEIGLHNYPYETAIRPLIQGWTEDSSKSLTLR